MNTIVLQTNINQPTKLEAQEVLKSMMESPVNNGLIDSYRELKRQMDEALIAKEVDALVAVIAATDDYKEVLADELKKDERRRNKRVPTGDVERVQWYIKQKKQSLPAVIPTVTHFAESKDRWGRIAMWRLQAYGYLSGLAVLDGDHVPNVEQRIDEWLKREDFSQLGIIWIFVTPSGEGVKVVFKAREEWGNLQDNAYQMGELLGILDYCDAQTKNSDHAHFIPKASDVKYVDWEALFTYHNPAYEARYGEAYRRGESDPTQPRWQELERKRKEMRKQTTEEAKAEPATSATVAGQSQSVVLSEREQAIVNALNRHYGEKIAEGHRHETFLSETAPWLLLLTDNNAQRALTMGRELEWVKNWTDQTADELQNCLDTVKRKPLLRQRPKALKELLQKAGFNDEQPMGEAEKTTDPMTTLPFDVWCDKIESFFDVFPGMREALEPHPRRLWPWLLFVAGGMMGTDMDLCYYYFYADSSERHRLNYIIWGVGDPTSGKHAMERLANHLLAPIIEEGKLADNSTNTWKSASDVKASNKDGEERPALYNRYFGARASNTEFIRSMVNSKELVDGEEMGRHMVTVDPEKDLTISKSGSWANKDSMMLRAFHCEYDSQHYSNKQSVSARFRVTWNIFETFTPMTLPKLINERTINSGLDTRAATLITGKADFSMLPLVRKEDTKIGEYNEKLRQIAYQLDQRRGELPIWPLVEHVHKWCDERRAIAEFNDDQADWLQIKRVPYYGIAVSAPFIDLRHTQEREQTGTYKIDEKDLELCDLALDIQYRTQHYFYYDLHRKYYDDQQRNAAQYQKHRNKFTDCFLLLPNEFNTEQFSKTFGYTNPKSAQKALQRLLAEKCIKRNMRGSYQKLVSAL